MCLRKFELAAFAKAMQILIRIKSVFEERISTILKIIYAMRSGVNSHLSQNIIIGLERNVSKKISPPL